MAESSADSAAISRPAFAPGSATGVGSMPGTDIVEAVKAVLGELPALPHLPELPARGPGADMTGRGAGLLTDLPVELYAGRWRIATHAGRDLRRTLDLWERDLDALMQAGAGYAGPIKVQAPGPWTLAASLDLPIGGAVLHDHGATRDLAASLADGLRRHVRDLSTRLPGAAVILQLDEPSLPAVLAGRVPTESGLRTLRAVSADVARTTLNSIVETVAVPVVVHCCAADPPIGLIRSAGVAGVSVDMSLLGTGGLDEVGELIDAGLALFAGAVPATGEQPPSAAAVATSLTGVWRRLGFAPALLAAQVVVTPACGLAGATPGYARSALAACVEAARRLTQE